MILMVTSSGRLSESGSLLQQAIGEAVEVCGSLRRATTMLRNGEYSAVILDDPMVDAEGDAVETLLNNLGPAVPVYVNLAVSNAGRIAREVKVALRRDREVRQIAIRAAEAQLRSEIRDAITGILLSTELALHAPGMPAEAVEKLNVVRDLANDIRLRLERAS